MPDRGCSCTKSVHGQKVKIGKTRQGKQRFRCKSCGKSFIERYTKQAFRPRTNEKITALLKEGCGIRSTARLLRISPTTVQSRIRKIAATVRKPAEAFGKDYEMDELCTFIGSKLSKRWVAYALRRDDKRVVDFRVGGRSNSTLRPVVGTLLMAGARRVYTDGLPNYRGLLDTVAHVTTRVGTNRIERLNLTLRTHLKRLGRKTLCFSRSGEMLNACLKVYFWG